MVLLLALYVALGVSRVETGKAVAAAILVTTLVVSVVVVRA